MQRTLWLVRSTSGGILCTSQLGACGAQLITGIYTFINTNQKVVEGVGRFRLRVGKSWI